MASLSIKKLSTAQFSFLNHHLSSTFISLNSGFVVNFFSQFQIGEIDFKDNVTFSFTLVLDPAREMPMGLDYVETVLPSDITSRGALRGDRSDTGVIASQVYVQEFGFSTGSLIC